MKIFSFKKAKILCYLTLCWLLAGTFSVLSGCNNQTSELEVITVELPQWPPTHEETSTVSSAELPSLAYWKVEVYGAETNQYKTVFAQDSSSFQISVKINEPLCVLATPITVSATGGLTEFFYPAGNCYPYADKNSTLILTWPQGFSAFVMKSLFLSGKGKELSAAYVNQFVSSFNWKKLEYVIDEKSSKDIYNPWFCDSVTLLQNLSEGSFKATLLNHKNVHKISTLPQEFLNSYVPWNFLDKEEEIIKTDRPNSFLYENCKLLLVIWKSEKNILQELINLPIYTEEI